MEGAVYQQHSLEHGEEAVERHRCAQQQGWMDGGAWGIVLEVHWLRESAGVWWEEEKRSEVEQVTEVCCSDVLCNFVVR